MHAPSRHPEHKPADIYRTIFLPHLSPPLPSPHPRTSPTPHMYSHPHPNPAPHLLSYTGMPLPLPLSAPTECPNLSALTNVKDAMSNAMSGADEEVATLTEDAIKRVLLVSQPQMPRR